MFLRVKYDPNLGMHHPHVHSLPTASIVGLDPIDKTMTVEIPDEDFPPSDIPLLPTTWVATHLGPVVNSGSDEFHQRWHAHLDERYQEHHGEFRPQLA